MHQSGIVVTRSFAAGMSESVNSPCALILQIPVIVNMCSIGDCGQLALSPGTDVYTIYDTQNTTVGSIILFECVHTNSIIALNKTLHHTECLDSGFWDPDPQTTCNQTTAAATVTNGLLINLL